MADTARARKLADRIREIVAEALEKRVKDPRLGFVTVTDARVTNDLQHATVFYTVDGSDPSDRNNDQRRSFEGSKTFTFEDVGSHAVLCFAQDGAGNEFSEAFAWTIGGKDHPG